MYERAHSSGIEREHDEELQLMALEKGVERERLAELFNIPHEDAQALVD